MQDRMWEIEYKYRMSFVLCEKKNRVEGIVACGSKKGKRSVHRTLCKSNRTVLPNGCMLGKDDFLLQSQRIRSLVGGFLLDKLGNLRVVLAKPAHDETKWGHRGDVAEWRGGEGTARYHTIHGVYEDHP